MSQGKDLQQFIVWAFQVVMSRMWLAVQSGPSQQFSRSLEGLKLKNYEFWKRFFFLEPVFGSTRSMASWQMYFDSRNWQPPERHKPFCRTVVCSTLELCDEVGWACLKSDLDQGVSVEEISSTFKIIDAWNGEYCRRCCSINSGVVAFWKKTQNIQAGIKVVFLPTLACMEMKRSNVWNHHPVTWLVNTIHMVSRILVTRWVVNMVWMPLPWMVTRCLESEGSRTVGLLKPCGEW